MNGFSLRTNKCSKIEPPRTFSTLEKNLKIFIINKAPHRAFNSSSTSSCNLTDDPIARELRRNSISIEKTTVHDSPVPPIRELHQSEGVTQLDQSESIPLGSPPFKLQGLTILTILNLKSKSFNCWQVTDHLRKLFPTYCQSDHFTVVMLKIVMFMSQNPQIFIRNEIFNSRVARQGIRVVGKIVELKKTSWKDLF